MSTIDFGKTVTLDEAATLITTIPDNIFLLEGEPGIGKSSIMKLLKEQLGDGYAYAYFDCAQKDLGDIAMPSPNRELKVTEYFPNAALQLQSGKPVVIMLDEFGKAPQPVQNMLHPLLEEHNQRLGDVALPAGSYVFLTTNTAGSNLGDSIKGHTLNRVTRVRVSKPDSEQWRIWASNNGIDPVVSAWVRQFPQALASYTDPSQADNAYIYNPKHMQRSFVSPRSLSKASNIVKSRDKNSANALVAALAGTIGEAAALDMKAYIAYQDQLPDWDSIIANPESVRVPDSAGARAILVYGAVEKLAKSNIDAIMTYLGRFEPEWQSCFAVTVAASKTKQHIAFESKSFTNWVQINNDIL
jgi:hypothetical protein